MKSNQRRMLSHASSIQTTGHHSQLRRGSTREAQTPLDAASVPPEPPAHEAGVTVEGEDGGKETTASAARNQESSLEKGADECTQAQHRSPVGKA